MIVARCMYRFHDPSYDYELTTNTIKMNSFLKAVLHSGVSGLGLLLPVIISSNHVFDVTLGTVVTLVFNYIVSHYVPTTTGASAAQIPTYK